jgi:hypothetical protein
MATFSTRQTMTTQIDLRQMVAEEAGVAAAGEALRAEDVAYIAPRMRSKLAELHEMGLTPFDVDGNDIPVAYALPLARVIAAEIVPGYGLNLPEAKALAEDGMRSLHRLRAKPLTGADTRSTYY